MAGPDGAKQSDFSEVERSARWLEERLDSVPEIALVLGSGLGTIADRAKDRKVFPYGKIPGFPVSSVEGHAGQLVVGEVNGVNAVMMQGRVHYYEGWELARLTFPVRVFAEAGVSTLLVTNSAGGVNPDYEPGDLMVISDHINLLGDNPLRGPNEERFGPRFPDMTYGYDPEIVSILRETGSDIDVTLHEGVYTASMGPSYETPAEVQMIQTLGGDAVGMSTVPEVIVGNHQNMRVGGVSCITNYAAGLSDSKLSHDEVKDVANRVQERFIKLIERTVPKL